MGMGETGECQNGCSSYDDLNCSKPFRLVEYAFIVYKQNERQAFDVSCSSSFATISKTLLKEA